MGVRVTEAEAEELQERAQAARLSMGAYLRRRALGQRVRSAVERRLGAAELRELNRIGVNLNQMERALNSGAVSARANIFGRLQTQFEESLGFVLRNLRREQNGKGVNTTGEVEIPKIVFEELLARTG